MALMKTFDTVSHTHLIQKLIYLTVDVKTVHWTPDFLTGKTHVVSYQSDI